MDVMNIILCRYDRLLAQIALKSLIGTQRLKNIFRFTLLNVEMAQLFIFVC